VVLLDLCFDNSADSGLELLAELRTSHPNLPVLVFTDKEDFANRVKVARLGRFFAQTCADCLSNGSSYPGATATDIVEAKILVVNDDPRCWMFCVLY